MSKCKPQAIVLKNNQEVILREATVADAPALLQCITTYIPDSVYIPKLEMEMVTDITEEESWIRTLIARPNALLLVAEHNGQLIGNIDLTGNSRKVMQHTAVVGMGMLSEWRNVGLGTALLEKAISWAKDNEILEMLWLQVYTANTAGIQLYQKMGFQENGTIPQFFKHEDLYFDQMTMSLKLT